MDIETLYKMFVEDCNGLICTDTRDNCIEGSLFFSWRGDQDNGNKYVREALQKGAKAIILDDDNYLVEGDKRYFLVDDAQKVLAQLANYHRKQFDVPVIALTGSNGKTTTKELIAAVLKTEKKVVAPEKSYNNIIGVSKTLLKINFETEIIVVEMGANHVGEISSLCKIVQPTHGLITNIGRAHLGLFGGFDGVVRAKTELYRYLEQHDGTIFVNGEDSLLLREANTDEKITYLSKYSDYPVVSKKTIPFVSVYWNDLEIKSHLTGEYNVMNISAALAVGNYFCVSDKGIKKGIEEYFPQNNRSEIIETEKGNIIIKDFYNANRSSVELAIKNLVDLDLNKKRIAVLGDMAELGEYAQEEHDAVVDYMLNSSIDEIFLIGDVFSDIKHKAPFIHKYHTIEDAIVSLREMNIHNFIVLLKSSRGPNPVPAFQKLFDEIDW